MIVHLDVMVAIVGMAVVTYLTRASGLWLVRQLTLPAPLQSWLDFIPGTVLAAIVAPTLLTGSPAEAIAGVTTILIAAISRNVMLASAVGVVAVWWLRQVFPG